MNRLDLLSNDLAVIVWIFLEESVRVVVGINVDLGHSVVSGRISGSFLDSRFQPMR